MKHKFIFPGLIAALLVIASVAWAHEKVKLSGYVVDVACASEHARDAAADAVKFAAEHTKECGLMDDCVKSGYGIFADGQWLPFDAKGNELAKALFEKSGKKDHITATVEGMKHGGKLMVEKLTEE
ncbi:MAG TPA: hypothetical protein VFD58_07990 [Blastocatellia bacterium]|nr:hypothetical protein [Blastocatellia bacterium]